MRTARPLQHVQRRLQADALARYERRAEPIVFVLAAASVPLLLVEDRWTPAQWLGWVIVGLFGLDLAVRVWLAPAPRRRYVRSHWLDVLIVVLSVLPVLRPLRMLRALQMVRLARLARLLLLGKKALNSARSIWGELRGKALLVACGAGGIVALGVVFLSERNAADSNIDSIGTTLWWAVTTVTTVGYGDTSPVTAAGRVAAASLMVVGIAVFGLVTANVTARFTRRSGSGELARYCPSCGAPVPVIAQVDEGQPGERPQAPDPTSASNHD